MLHLKPLHIVHPCKPGQPRAHLDQVGLLAGYGRGQVGAIDACGGLLASVHVLLVVTHQIHSEAAPRQVARARVPICEVSLRARQGAIWIGMITCRQPCWAAMGYWPTCNRPPVAHLPSNGSCSSRMESI
eukprot:1156484-Pelagomonas_calceolata.AAC.1